MRIWFLSPPTRFRKCVLVSDKLMVNFLCKDWNFMIAPGAIFYHIDLVYWGRISSYILTYWTSFIIFHCIGFFLGNAFKKIIHQIPWTIFHCNGPACFGYISQYWPTLWRFISFYWSSSVGLHITILAHLHVYFPPSLTLGFISPYCPT